MSDEGSLVLVGTPIGNLGDLAPRAAEALAGADAVCCEDTRRTGKLLSLAGIERRPLVVVNEHTEGREIPRVLARLARGERVALVSDAGMPGISDPGERLVAAAVAAGHPVEVVPGPSARLAALVVSGLPAGRFVFEGFLPRKGSGRTERLAAVADERRTTVLYEAPHRLARTLAELAAACGEDRRVVVARELTKLHEEVWRGAVAGAAPRAGDRPPPGRRNAGRQARWSSCWRVRPRPPRRATTTSSPPFGTSWRPAPPPATRRGPWRPGWRCRGAGPTTSQCGSAHHVEVLGRDLGGHDVDHHAGALLEPGHAGDPRQHVHVPVERAGVAVRRGVEHEVVGDPAKAAP